MTTDYVKTGVGNKLFTVEWNLDASNEQVQGQAFEAADCKLLSVSAYTSLVSGLAPTPKLYFGNYADLPANPGLTPGFPLFNASGANVISPIDSDVGIVFPPYTRWIFPRLESESGVSNSKVALLFEETK